MVVDDTVDINKVADKLVEGRYCINTGQNCTSPEFVIFNKSKQDELVKALKRSMKKIIGDEPNKSDVYFGIVNKRHFNRLKNIIDNIPKDNIATGGAYDEKELYIEPVVVKDCDMNSFVMQQESFGPILSLFPVDDVEKDALKVLQAYPKPLILFVFSNDEKFVKKIVDRTDSGAITINSVTDHFAYPGFPFGGSGNSGWGRYHGKYSFLAFSHEKPVLTADL